MYLHLYYNLEKAVEDDQKRTAYYVRLENELRSGKHKPEHEKDYAKYFTVHETPVRGKKIVPNNEAMSKARRLYGYFVRSATRLRIRRNLQLYRTRDVVEKAFGNLKERLNCRRTLVSSDASLEGKLFVTFVSLIYLSYIKDRMQKNELFSKYTLQELLPDESDVIECFTETGKTPIQGEVLKKYRRICIQRWMLHRYTQSLVWRHREFRLYINAEIFSAV